MPSVKKDTHNTKNATEATRTFWMVLLLALVGIGAAAYLGYQSYTTTTDLGTTREALMAVERELFDARAKIAQLEEGLEETQGERDRLDEELEEEKEKNEAFEEQIEDIADTVGVLDKLSKTDEELLQKYSRVYFLNEHYMPERLSEIDPEYLYNENRDQYLHANVMPFFEDMIDDAQDDDIDLWVISAFRSFDTQAELKGQYVVTYGEGANTFSADQGFSEHQLGTTIDFTTTGLGGGLQGFENTPAYEWLLENAHKYGFTLSYPPDNAFYIFEPWHWRFVGTDLARDLHRDDLYFYDLDQREIDEYLISIFD